jgi:hypothetical protein
MNRIARYTGTLTVLALLVAWAGAWAAWVPHRSLGLTQNAIDLAEWSTYLPEVRFGGLRLMPELLRLAITLCSVALAVAAGALENRWLRRVARLLAFLPGVVLLPPYPHLMQLWWSESYGLRFIAALVGLLSPLVGVLCDRLSTVARRALLIGVSLAAAALGLRAFLALRGQLAAYYPEPIAVGRGALMFLAGLLAAALLQGITFLPRKQPASEPPLAAAEVARSPHDAAPFWWSN